MELRHLRYFVAVAEELNMRIASEKLHISQPPLSRQIRDLEYELGTKLFDRRKKRLWLTQSGEYFLKEAKDILLKSRNAVKLVKAVDRGEAGSLSIAYRVFTPGLMPTSVIRKCRGVFPSMKVVINQMTNQEQFISLLENRIDLGYVGYAHSELGSVLQFEAMKETELLVALPSEHRLAKKRTLDFTELSDEPFIFLEKETSPLAYDWMFSFLKNYGLTPNIVQHVDNQQNLFILISAGFGVSLIPDIYKHFILPGVVFRPLKHKVKYSWVIAWRKDNSSPLLATFLKLLRKEIGKT